MKQLLSIVFTASVAIVSAFSPAASEPAPPKAPAKVVVKNQTDPVSRTFTGYLVDNHCAGKHKKNMAKYIKTHTRECMKQNGNSRFSLYMADSNKIIPICMEMGGVFQSYVEKFNEGLFIEITGYMRKDSIYSQMYKGLMDSTGKWVAP